MNYDDFFRTATGGQFGPYAFQRAFATAEHLPDLLRAPTGSGKTATAVLGWWWRRKLAPEGLRLTTPRRLVFCLPMRSLVTQTVDAIAEWGANLAAAGLDVGVSTHALLGGGVDQTWEIEPERDLVLVGTQDQLLSRALNRGYAMSRYRWSVHFGLLNNDALWVMDEVQLMGVGLSTSAQLQAFGHATYGPRHTVWMSATLAEGRLDTVNHDVSGLRRLELSEEDRSHPQLSRRLSATKHVEQLPDVFDKKVASYAKQLAPSVLDAHRTNGGRTLVVMNQVDRAVALTRTLRASAPDMPVYVIHSRFRPAERRAVQAEALDAPNAIVVATQTIEAGVDLSSRTLFTELASWSSLVQRFGRCNRAGEYVDGASIHWIDLPDDEKLALPYTPDELAIARKQLAAIPDSDAAPDSLPSDPGPHAPVGPVLRRRDLADLFDTAADLSGFDVDVSRYIRDTGAPDVQVAWRSWEGSSKGAKPDDGASRRLERDELCRVPLHRFEKLYGRRKAGWVWDPLHRPAGGRRTGAWIRASRVKPGDLVLLPITAGGYHADETYPQRSLGFTGDAKDRPSDLPEPEGPLHTPESDEGEPDSLLPAGWVTLRDHSLDVRGRAEELAAALFEDIPWASVIQAAHWHDLGKVHPAWQEMIRSRTEAPEEILAKRPVDAPRTQRLARRFYRHELASALAYLAHGDGDDLVAFLIAAHHGKVRTAIRSRPEEQPTRDALQDSAWNAESGRVALGVYDGETLPAADLGAGLETRAVPLDLECMALGAPGGSWIERVASLLDEYGPYRLAYLEALVRIADWRASSAPTLHDADEAPHA